MAGPDRWRRGRVAALVPVLAFAGLAVATVAGLVAHPDLAGAQPVASHVIIAGAAGLRWEDVDPEQTPNLWKLADGGSIGSMSVRSAHRPTCAADGWLTLGAGNWAAGTISPSTVPCPSLDVALEPDGPVGAFLPEQEVLVRHNRVEQPWGAVPGALAGSVACTVAVGEGAAVAAARSYGGVDRYRSALPEEPAVAADLLADHCELSIIDLGTVSGEGGARAVAARRVDAALAGVLAARPPGSLLLVAGVAETGIDPHLHVAVGDAPGLGRGWLTSATTGRVGYLQLVDLAPTTLAAVGRPLPDVKLAGHPVHSRPDRPADLREAVTDLVAADREVTRTEPVSGWFLGVLTVAQLALFVAVVPVLRWSRPPPGRPGPGTPAGRWVGRRAGPRAGRWWRSAGPVLLVVSALAIPAALAAEGVPWWRAEAAGRVFTITALAVMIGASVLVVRAPIFRRALGVVGAGAGIAAAAVTVDLFTGSWLQLNGVVGYSAYDGGRYAGLSKVGLGVLIAGTLLLAACLAEQVARWTRPMTGGRWTRPMVVATVGGAGVVLAGSPYLGADIGGAVALATGVCLTAALSPGGWLTVRRAIWAMAAGCGVVAAVALFDLRRPVDERTGLGGLLTQVAEGTAGFGVQRVSLANVEAFTATPLTVLAIGAGGFLWFALLRPWGGLRRLFAIHPALRAATTGAVVAALLAGVLVGAALTVAGAAAAVGVPLLTLAALRRREQAPRPAPHLPVSPQTLAAGPSR